MTSPVLPGVPSGTAHTGAGVHLVLWAALLTAVLPLDVVGVEDGVLLDNQTVQRSQQLYSFQCFDCEGRTKENKAHCFPNTIYWTRDKMLKY